MKPPSLSVASVIIHPDNGVYELFCLDCAAKDRPGAQQAVDAWQLVQLRDLGCVGPKCCDCGQPVHSDLTPVKTPYNAT